MLLKMPHRRFLFLLTVPLGIEFVVLAIAPNDRKAWLLENVLVLVFLGGMFASYRKLTLSRISYFLIFLFLSLHLIGAPYTYARVPYDRWFESLTGRSLNSLLGWERNNFDRVVHFFYGLLLAYPVREVFQRVARLRGFWGYFFPLDITMSTSMLYELIEWGAAVAFGGELGQAYLGTQGDITQGDNMGCAQGHGVRQPRRTDRNADNRGNQCPVAARFRRRVKREPSRENQPAARRGRDAPAPEPRGCSLRGPRVSVAQCPAAQPDPA